MDRTLEIRRAAEADFPGICALAGSYYRENPAPADRRQGFLSARFSLQQIADMANGLGIVIASDAGQVAGFACASRCDWTGQPAIVRHLVDHLSRYRFHGRPIDRDKVFVYGPVCIDADYRGRGILRNMYQYLQRGMEGRYSAGVAFVADDNEASLRAHIDGLGMSKIGEFEYRGRIYQALAFDIATAEAPAISRQTPA
ncbi:hypothetical protein GALL_69680 [mine drainage metagenome]|uniref:N-acetyltransferase domain-containing protein n=1 Tax=mine drainage metagenome TaxID=410659 RepID=A0A1J5SU16_9ZZZZ